MRLSLSCYLCSPLRLSLCSSLELLWKKVGTRFGQSGAQLVKHLGDQHCNQAAPARQVQMRDSRVTTDIVEIYVMRGAPP